MFVLVVVMKAAELNTSAAGKHAEKVWLGKHLMSRTATKLNKKLEMMKYREDPTFLQ